MGYHSNHSNYWGCIDEYMSNFIINLSTESNSYSSNDYGYWTGKTYTLNGEVFPVCDKQISVNTKRYTSRKRAENMAKKLYEKCSYVGKYSVEEETQ